MAHGPKSAQRRARRVRNANRIAQTFGVKGAKDLLDTCFQDGATLALEDPRLDACIAAIAAGY